MTPAAVAAVVVAKKQKGPASRDSLSLPIWLKKFYLFV